MGLYAASLTDFADEPNEEIEWSLVKDKRGIQVYTRKVIGSKYKAVLTNMEVKSNIRSVVALLLDLPNCSAWASMCRKAYVVERLSASQQVVYGRNNLPFPVLDRDSYSLNTWKVNPQSGDVVMVSRVDERSNYPEVDKVIRLSKADVVWRISKINDDTLLIENEAHIEPNGALPAWLTNTLQVEAPYKTMRGLRSLLKTEEYNAVRVDFLENEPASEKQLKSD